MLKDDFKLSGNMAYHITSKLLFTAGHKKEASVAQCLRRYYFYDMNPVADGDSDAGEDESRLLNIKEAVDYRLSSDYSMDILCPNRFVEYAEKTMYSRMTCINTNLCETCCEQHIKKDSTSQQKFYPCNARHEHIKTPLENWRLMHSMMTIDAKKISVESWLGETEKMWHESLMG
jgi:hypothetical protein